MSETTTGNLKVIGSLGLGVVLAYLAFEHFVASDKQADKFLQTTFIETMKENAKSQTEAAAAMNRVAEEMDDISDTSREVVRRFDRMIAEGWRDKEQD